MQFDETSQVQLLFHVFSANKFSPPITRGLGVIKLIKFLSINLNDVFFYLEIGNITVTKLQTIRAYSIQFIHTLARKKRIVK